MRINQGILRQARIDEENLLLLERAAECYVRCLDLYGRLDILLPERGGNGYISVLGFYNGPEGFTPTEGEPLSEHEIENATAALEGCRLEQAPTGDLFIPLCRNRRKPFGLVRIGNSIGIEALKRSGNHGELFSKNLHRVGRAARLSPGLLGEPTVYIDSEGTLQDLNNGCGDFRTYFSLEGNWVEAFINKGTPKVIFQELIREELCQGVDMDIDGFSFLAVTCPVFTGKERVGTLLMLSDTTEVRDMQQEVINKSTVIREIHHRVKNNLQTIASLLRLQSRRSNNALVDKALMESINRISSIALIHEALSKEGQNTVGMKECIRSIMGMVLGNMADPSKNIRGELTGPEIFLNSSQASSISLCITELLQNAVEHAFVVRKKGSVLVAIDQVGGEVVIVVEDDGVGFQGRKARGNSLGLQIIDMITTENLKGSFRLEGHTYGSRAEIRFPL